MAVCVLVCVGVAVSVLVGVTLAVCVLVGVGLMQTSGLVAVFVA